MLLIGIGLFGIVVIVYLIYLIKAFNYKVDIQTEWWEKSYKPGWSYFSQKEGIECSTRKTGLKAFGHQLFVNKGPDSTICGL